VGLYANEVHGKPVAKKDEVFNLLVVLDRSGSMAMIRLDMQGGFDAYIADQCRGPGEMHVTLCQFDTEYENVYKDVDVCKVPKLELIPRGSTALLDAVFKAVSSAKETGNKHTVMIITDGEENSSHEVNREQVKKLIEGCEALGWTFVFLGANQDAFVEAGAMGIYLSGVQNYSPDGKSVSAAYDTVSLATTRSRSGQTGDTGGFFDEDEQDVRSNT
jgi:hypothetical protein